MRYKELNWKFIVGIGECFDLSYVVVTPTEIKK